MESEIHNWINNRACNKPNRYDLYNRNGDTICHIIGCRRHVGLKYQFRGWFCSSHLYMMQYIRSYLHKGNNEVYWIHLEIYLRKIPDSKHIHYVRRINNI